MVLTGHNFHICTFDVELFPQQMRVDCSFIPLKLHFMKEFICLRDRDSSNPSLQFNSNQS